MENKDIRELLLKYRKGIYTKEEKVLIENWITFGEFTEQELSDAEIEKELSIVSRGLPVVKVKSLWPRIAAAASIIIVFSTGLYFYHNVILSSSKDNGITLSLSKGNGISAGGNKAVLTLANGKHILLTDAKNGDLANENNIIISKTADGQVVYTSRHPESTHHPDAGQDPGHENLNTMATPRGGQYTITLSDGTKVTLNAASSLKYPAAFVGNNRKVELSGEAYFEVAKVLTKDKGSKNKEHRMPFIVVMKNQTVEVLGTHFNVNAYQDEPVVKTTLLEGIVKVAGINGGDKILKPGEQSTSDGNAIKVAEADTELAMDWKNGDFIFKEESLNSLMRRVARWYNVNIDYDQGVDKNQTFTGKVSRTKNISEVLKALKSAGHLKFDIAGNRITIKN